jgi:hypothetical protein
MMIDLNGNVTCDMVAMYSLLMPYYLLESELVDEAKKLLKLQCHAA